MADDDFGAGLETNPVTVPETQIVPTNDGITDDLGLQWFRSRFEGLPEDGDLSTLTEFFTETQKTAQEAQERAERLEAQLADLSVKAMQTPTEAAAANIAATGAAVGEAKKETERRYKAAKAVDPRLMPYLGGAFSAPGEDGFYRPTADYKNEPGVRLACDAINEGLQTQRQILNDFTTDPYAATDHLFDASSTAKQMREEMAALRKQNEEMQARFAQQISPLQQGQEEAALTALISRNLDILATKDGQKFTPLGEMFNRMVAKPADGGLGIDPMVAIEEVKRTAAAMAPPKVEKKKPRMTSFAQRTSNGVNFIPEQNGRAHTNGASRWQTSFREMGVPISTE